MFQPFLENELVQLKLRDDLLQPRVLFRKALQFRQLRPSHPTETLTLVVVGRITDPDITTC